MHTRAEIPRNAHKTTLSVIPRIRVVFLVSYYIQLQQLHELDNRSAHDAMRPQRVSETMGREAQANDGQRECGELWGRRVSEEKKKTMTKKNKCNKYTSIKVYIREYADPPAHRTANTADGNLILRTSSIS